jgi:hypothetical protein
MVEDTSPATPVTGPVHKNIVRPSDIKAAPAAKSLGGSLAGASMAINILPCGFHPIQVVGRQIQLVLGEGIVVRLEHFGACPAHLPHELRAVILWGLNRVFKYGLVALQCDCNPLFLCSKRLPLLSLDFDAVGVNVVQVE